ALTHRSGSGRRAAWSAKSGMKMTAYMGGGSAAAITMDKAVLSTAVANWRASTTSMSKCPATSAISNDGSARRERRVSLTDAGVTMERGVNTAQTVDVSSTNRWNRYQAVAGILRS